MSPGFPRSTTTWMVYLLLAGVALANSGCLIVAAGACAGGAAGYIYCKGKVCENFVADFGDAWTATHTALHELGMPVEKEDRSGVSGVIHSRTAAGQEVRITLDTTISPIPAAGSITCIGLRVGVLGDTDVSEHFLHQVSSHLSSAPPGTGPVVTPTPTPTLGPIAAQPPAPQSTAPPPLAAPPGAPPPAPVPVQPTGKP